MTELPANVQGTLMLLRYSGDHDKELRQYIQALCHHNWPVRAIAKVINVPHTTVQYWADNTPPNPNPPKVPTRPETRGTKTVRQRTHVLVKDREVLQALAHSARKVTRQTQPGSQHYADAELLDEIIQECLNRQVSATEIAGYMGVTPRAVKDRMERRKP